MHGLRRNVAVVTTLESIFPSNKSIHETFDILPSDARVSSSSLPKSLHVPEARSRILVDLLDNVLRRFCCHSFLPITVWPHVEIALSSCPRKVMEKALALVADSMGDKVGMSGNGVDEVSLCLWEVVQLSLYSGELLVSTKGVMSSLRQKVILLHGEYVERRLNQWSMFLALEGYENAGIPIRAADSEVPRVSCEMSYSHSNRVAVAPVRPLASHRAKLGTCLMMLSRRLRVDGRSCLKDGVPVLPPGVEVHWQKVVIRNARNMQPEPTLMEDGIELRSVRSRVTDWADRDHADKLWCEEVIEHVIFMRDPVHRDGMEKLRGYGVSARTDYCQYCEKNLKSEIKEQCRGKHFGNLWRSTDMHSPVKCFLLACLRPASVRPSDMVYCEHLGEAVYKKLIEEDQSSAGSTSCMDAHSDPKVVDGIRYSTYRAVAAHKGLVPDRKKEDPRVVFRPVHSQRHSWLYFPDMTPDEILLFRQYDTRIGEVTKAPVAHAAFREPSASADVPCRQ